MIGFSLGFFVVVSTHIKEIGNVCYSHCILWSEDQIARYKINT